MTDAAITAIATVLSAAISAFAMWLVGKGKLRKVQGQLSQAEQYLKAESNAMRYEHEFAASASIRDQFQRLCEETEVDRILLLVAWNGMASPRWTKAIYQFRHGEQELVEYLHTTLDDDYRKRLFESKSAPAGMQYRVEDMPDESLIKQIYVAEGVKVAGWFFLRENQYDEGNCYSYLSFASHETESIAPDVMTRIRLLVDQMRSSV